MNTIIRMPSRTTAEKEKVVTRFHFLVHDVLGARATRQAGPPRRASTLPPPSPWPTFSVSGAAGSVKHFRETAARMITIRPRLAEQHVGDRAADVTCVAN